MFIHSEEDDVEMSDVGINAHDDSETETSGESGDEDEDDDMTDEEDWAQIGAEVLRRYGGSPMSAGSDGWSGSYGRNSPGQGMWNLYQGAQLHRKHLSVPPLSVKESLEQKRTREEREAVEALMKLSSV